METPVPLFSIDEANLIVTSADTRFIANVPYDVTADGRRFVMVRPVGQAGETSPKIIVVENWAKAFEAP